MTNKIILIVLNPFILYGFLLTALLLISQTKKIKVFTKSILFVVTLIIIFTVYYLTMPPIYLGESKWSETSPFREIIFYTIMIIGMMIRYITKAIEKRKKQIKKTKSDISKSKIEFDKWEFAYPFLLSFLTFAALMQIIQDDSITFSNSVISFQFGFFWQTILNK